MTPRKKIAGAVTRVVDAAVDRRERATQREGRGRAAGDVPGAGERDEHTPPPWVRLTATTECGRRLAPGSERSDEASGRSVDATGSDIAWVTGASRTFPLGRGLELELL